MEPQTRLSPIEARELREVPFTNDLEANKRTPLKQQKRKCNMMRRLVFGFALVVALVVLAVGSYYVYQSARSGVLKNTPTLGAGGMLEVPAVGKPTV